MDPTELRNALINFPAVTEEEPFGPDTIVYKVAGKVYALSTYQSPLAVNLKCDSTRAQELRNRYDAVQPGYHMNKKHWNTVTIDGSLPKSLLLELIEHSYDLVVNGLPKKAQKKVKEMSKNPESEIENWRETFLRDISK
jgi:predicted DNA-binding protein (MmcQ/YjbR family)